MAFDNQMDVATLCTVDEVAVSRGEDDGQTAEWLEALDQVI